MAVTGLKSTVVPRSRPRAGGRGWSWERQLLCLAAVVASSSTGWQACLAFKDTSVPTVSLQWEALLVWAPPLLFSCSPPAPAPTPMLTRGAHASHFLREAGRCNSLTMEQAWAHSAVLCLIMFPPHHQPQDPGKHPFHSRRV